MSVYGSIWIHANHCRNLYLSVKLCFVLMCHWPDSIAVVFKTISCVLHSNRSKDPFCVAYSIIVHPFGSSCGEGIVHGWLWITNPQSFLIVLYWIFISNLPVYIMFLVTWEEIFKKVNICPEINRAKSCALGTHSCVETGL